MNEMPPFLEVSSPVNTSFYRVVGPSILSLRFIQYRVVGFFLEGKMSMTHGAGRIGAFFLVSKMEWLVKTRVCPHQGRGQDE